VANATPVPLTNSANLLVPVVSSLPKGFRNIILFSGVLETPSAGGVQVEVQIVIDSVVVYFITVELATANSPAPFGLSFESAALASGSTISIQALTTGVGQTATAASGSGAIISTPT